ncbi:hypothetical protein JQK87_26045 [Streptomyces sp. G44]|uniref:hypothetical protein n=1 Tax=Streptomyces sp. G44 TaxID=2807632 RepID=UPI00196068FF|nr:hypothetical protein [Streptomyces sp. G44]MBM7171802.1 hypothetical protein [Streptomyces sp. G44]
MPLVGGCLHPSDETARPFVWRGSKTRAYSVRDVVAFLQEAGLQGWDEMDVVRSSIIEWRGGSPEDWR